MRSRIPVIVLMLALSGWATGCKKQKPVTIPPPAEPAPTTEPAQPAPPPKETVTDFPAEQPTAQDMDPGVDELNRQGVLKTIYFAYDSNDIDQAATAILQGNATWLKGHAKYNVEVGGHCDERGSIGYNVALGDRRANAVKSYLVSLGADGSKLVAVSYGEEKPADPGHEEAAFAKNRRAEFTIKP